MLGFPPLKLGLVSNVRSLFLLLSNITLFNDASPELHFSHFGKSLRALSLRYRALDPTVLFDFLSLLPNVRDLEIASHYPHTTALDTIPDVPKVTPSFCGTLPLANFHSRDPILRALVALPFALHHHQHPRMRLL